MRFISSFFMLILSGPAISAATEPDAYEDHAEIQSAVIGFIESNLRHKYSKFDIELLPMDRRLKFIRCKSPLETFFPPGQTEIGALTVGVRCPSPNPWLIYSRAQVAAFGPVVVTARPLQKGTVITAQDITLKEFELTRIHQPFFDDPEHVVGKELRRSLAAGSILTAHKLAVPKAVKRGQHVIILAKNKGMQIRMMGAAMSDGAIGQTIGVRNISSNRIIQGMIKGPGIVQIQF
jgi:flagellar basal body P-ring formation protein FlgA